MCNVEDVAELYVRVIDLLFQLGFIVDGRNQGSIISCTMFTTT